MHMSVTIKGAKLSSQIAIPDAVWQRIGKRLVENIKTRTAHGVDADGGAFEPYSEGYAKYKAKYGSTRVNLRSQGPIKRSGGTVHMMDNLVARTNATQNPRITIQFALTKKAEIAQYHMGEGRVDRLFFGLSDADADIAEQMVRTHLNRG
jgi:hypothetical protein